VDLSHVLWIGGGPASGKSSIARELARRFDLQLYSVDERDATHEPRMPLVAAGETVGFMTAARHRFSLATRCFCSR
jgi:adenylylsulfate kinase-like enzyme